MVKTRKMRSVDSIDADAVAKLGVTLNKNLVGLTAEEITLPIIMNLEHDMGNRSDMISVAVKGIYETMSELDGGELKLSGLNRLLQYPEYADSEQLGELLGALESKDEILDLVKDESDSDGVKVVLGSESSVKVMNQSAIVYKQIKKNGRTIGAVGIIGPLRMDYAKVLATIDSLGGNISDLIDVDDEIKLLKEKEMPDA